MQNCVVNHIKEFTMSTVNIETFFIKVSNAEQPLNFGIVYRTPIRNITNFYNQLKRSLKNCNTIVISQVTYARKLPSGCIGRYKFEAWFISSLYVTISKNIGTQ